MTFEIDSDHAGNSSSEAGNPASGRWTPSGRRHGERRQWGESAQSAQEQADDRVFPPLSPPPVWPRVFPGI
jgi:hypothetical protein